jgi:RsmE family RNA methyltransferase
MLKELPLNFDWIALDNGRAEKSLSNYCFKKANVGLVLGSERGLTNRERDLLEEKAISLLKMGERVLRTDTACIAGIAITLSKLRLM